MITDPENPMSAPMSVEDKVRAQLEEEREKKIMDELLAKNNIEIPEDFIVPEPSAEQLEEMKKQQEMQQQMMMEQMQKQQQQQQSPEGKKPEPKKK
jgi:FKBP-type peptidyl-prolyl cis-trans isomerase (trigger factor)